VFFVTFLAPIFTVIVFSVVIFILVTRVLVIHARKKNKSIKSTMKTMISIMGIMVMFGLTWLFGALTVREASTAFQYLFVIFNGFQGFFFFVFICLLGKDGREFWIDVITCCRIKRHTKSSTSYSRASQYKSQYQSSYIKQKTVLTSVRISNPNFVPQLSSSSSSDSDEMQSENNLNDGKVNDDVEMGTVIINHEAIITGSLIQEVEVSLTEPKTNLDANSDQIELELSMESESDTGKNTEACILITPNEYTQDEAMLNRDIPIVENASDQESKGMEQQKLKALSSEEGVESTDDGECNMDEESTGL